MRAMFRRECLRQEHVKPSRGEPGRIRRKPARMRRRDPIGAAFGRVADVRQGRLRIVRNGEPRSSGAGFETFPRPGNDRTGPEAAMTLRRISGSRARGPEARTAMA